MWRIVLALGAVLAEGCNLVFSIEDPFVERCSGPGSFTDDFEGATLDPRWLVSGALTVSGGRLQLGGPNRPYVQTHEAFDMRNAEVTVEAIQVDPAGFVNGAAGLGLGLPQYPGPAGVVDGVGMQLSGAGLAVGRFEVDSFIPIRTLPYDPVAHRFWKIAQHGPTTRWSVSPDGETWTEVQSFDLAWTPDYVVASLYSNFVAAGAMTFDHFNGGGPARARVCLAETLRDDFSGSTLQSLWATRTVPGGCTIAQQDGLSFSLTNAFTDCVIGTSIATTLIDSSFALEIEPRDVSDHAFPMLHVLFPTKRASLELAYDSDTPLVVAYGDSGSRYTTAPYDRVAHRWFRLRGERVGSEQQLIWETSPDGQVYNLLFKTRDYTDLDRARFTVGVSPGGSTATVLFHGVNTR